MSCDSQSDSSSPPVSSADPSTILFFALPDDRVLSLNGCSLKTNYGELKEKLEETHGLPAEELTLKHKGVPLDDGKSPHDCSLTQQCVIECEIQLHFLRDYLEVDASYLARDYDFDWRASYHRNQQLWRGNQVYYPPIGWHRCALDVLGRYESDDWLHRTWVNGYHGTTSEKVKSIVEDGFEIGGQGVPRRNPSNYEAGIFFYDRIDLAESFALKLPVKGLMMQTVVQVRLDPLKMRRLPCGSLMITDKQAVRPYCICFKTD